MIGSRLSSLCVLGLVAVSHAFAEAAPEQRDLAAEVKAVFQAKCVQCHGPQVRKPKGKFGYILDLKKLAADPDKVVPGKPEESQLWQLVHDDEMPPEEAKNGPLTAEQKEIIRAWIEAGAPSTSSVSPAAPTPTAPSAESVPTPSAEKRFLRWLGKFHVMVVHFPIALLLAAAAGEVWSLWRRNGQPAPAVRFCVLLGAISAVVSAVLGWLHAASGYGLDSPVILAWHRNFGTATAIASVILAVLSEIESRRGMRSWWFRLLLLLVALLVAVAGYFGGRLAYGDDFFNW
jgi:uncharacterized membrane protein/mono/diheme cytochrome c family protein